jgi:hypothetical protein
VPSYSPVFSQQFILSGASGGATAFLVPTGFTAVARDLTAYALLAATLVQLQVQDSESAPWVTVVNRTLAGVGTSAEWQGRIVIPEGGQMQVITDAETDGLDIYVGGYLLRNTLT